MKYAGMPMGMWVLFAGSFQKQLTAVLGYDADTAKAIKKKAKPKYRQIIRGLPEFEKADRFKMNLVNSAMIGAFIHAAAPGGGKPGRLLRKIHDDKAYAVVLPQERKQQVYRKGYRRHESCRCPESR